MKIKILGTRGEIPGAHPQHLKHSGILIDDKIMLDIGEEEFLKHHPKFIFITHLHPDHAFFMNLKERISIAVPVYAPEKSEKLKTVDVITNPLELAGYKIVPIPLVHSTKVKSLGYLIERGNKRIFYTGDLALLKKQYLKRLGKLDLIITEASFLRKGGLIRKDIQGEIFGHAGIPDLINLFEKNAAHICFTHFGTWFIKDISSGIQKIKSMERSGLKLSVANDGAEYKV